MRIRTTTLKNGTKLYYVIKTSYDADGKEHSVTVEKLGSGDDIRSKYDMDPDEWARKHVSELNEKEKSKQKEIIVKFSNSERIKKDFQYDRKIGYLFLQKIYYELGFDSICKEISKKRSFDYDLNAVLSRLLYGRILNPCSKLSTYQYSTGLLEPPEFKEHQIYRSLDVLADNFDMIQSRLYSNSFALGKRKTGVIYYDCTNFFFEVEEPDLDNGLRQYGKSKENRPLPIVEMGLFIDSEGIPLAMCIHPGNTNEQVTMRPLEKTIMEEYGLSKFVVCADAGLSSAANKRYNSFQDKAFVVTQSIKKLKKEYREWALDLKGWKLADSIGSKDYSKEFDISELKDEKLYNDRIFYKERYIDHGTFEEKVIVTYSIKYREYQKHIRDKQLERARKAIASGAKKISKKNANDYRRFVICQGVTDDGELASKNIYEIDEEAVKEEAKYDGFYAVCTNLDDDVNTIIKVNKYRWKIEECFRIMKTEFRSRPVYVSRQNRIKAHFLTCYLALVIFRYVEKKLNYDYTCSEIIDTLSEMSVREIIGAGFIPSYTRTDITDRLHEAFGFRTDYCIMSNSEIKKIIKCSKEVKKDAKK